MARSRLVDQKVDAVVAYIDRQMEHHGTRTFQEEFLEMLAANEVEYDRSICGD